MGKNLKKSISLVQLFSRVQLFVTPVDCSMPGFPVLHYLPEFTQTHVHRVSDTNQLSYPLSPPTPPPTSYPALSLCQHQNLFQ